MINMENMRGENKKGRQIVCNLNGCTDFSIFFYCVRNCQVKFQSRKTKKKSPFYRTLEIFMRKQFNIVRNNIEKLLQNRSSNDEFRV